MKAGFAKVDITPRVGVELCGFGPFLNRHSIGVRDKLWARAMVLQHNDQTVAVISCDLIEVNLCTTHKVRALISDKTGIVPENIMLHCTHTHSGPTTCNLHGWGDMDFPYMELLPHRIAKACFDAFDNLQQTDVFHAEVPCEGIGLNREYDIDAPPLDIVLQPDWRPAKPELTDTTCHVVKFMSKNKFIGFFSYFGCHPVVCCQQNHYIHGDYCGVAMNMLECEQPDAVGLFLQGAQGDVNSCVVHKPEQESLHALDIIAARFANSVRKGILDAQQIDIDSIGSAVNTVTFSRKKIALATLEEWLTNYEASFTASEKSDSDREIRINTVYVNSLRNIIRRIKAGECIEPPTEIQGIKLGPISLLAAPFEIFQAIKNDVFKSAKSPIPLVMGITNDTLGYAPDKEKAGNDGYADKQVPLMVGELPFANIHDELVEALLEIDTELSSTNN